MAGSPRLENKEQASLANGFDVENTKKSEPEGFNDESAGQESLGPGPTQLNFEGVGEDKSEKEKADAKENEPEESNSNLNRRMTGKQPRRDDNLDEQEEVRRPMKAQKKVAVLSDRKSEDENEELPKAERRQQKKIIRTSIADQDVDEAEEAAPGNERKVQKSKRGSIADQEVDEAEEQKAKRGSNSSSVMDQDVDESTVTSKAKRGSNSSSVMDQDVDEAEEQVPGTARKARPKKGADQDADEVDDQERMNEKKTPARARRGSIDQLADDDKMSSKDREIKRLRLELETTKKKLQGSRDQLKKSLVQAAKAERDKATTSASREYARIGRWRSLISVGLEQGKWEGGTEAEAIEQVRERLREERPQIENLRRNLDKQRPKNQRAKEPLQTNKGPEDEKNANGGEDADQAEMREVCNHRVAYLSREETSIKEREAKLRLDRSFYLQHQKRLDAQEASNYSNYPILDGRYQLLNLIGKGTYSEVFKAFDLEDMTMIAVKIHDLSNDKRLTDPQRQECIKRAQGQYDNQQELKSLKHPRIVTLLNCFGISNDAFVTVLELCRGDTLDAHMKKFGPLAEKEARGIIIQILSGLKYMNTCGRKIIHYDLKPGNLFFHCGEVKISDFGMASIRNEFQNTSGSRVELTSRTETPGAVTLWYLPPECFEGDSRDSRDSNSSRTCSKVDVWSTGVIFFELLFNRKPFGHGQDQETLMRSAAVGGYAFEVEIPQTPKISPEARDFLKRLLTSNRDLRPDVMEAWNDPYLKKKP